MPPFILVGYPESILPLSLNNLPPAERKTILNTFQAEGTGLLYIRLELLEQLGFGQLMPLELMEVGRYSYRC